MLPENEFSLTPITLTTGEHKKAAGVAGLVLPSSSSSSLSAIRNDRHRIRNRTQDFEKDGDDVTPTPDDSSSEKRNEEDDAAGKKEWEEVVWLFGGVGVS